MSTENEGFVLEEFAGIIDFASKWNEKKNKFSKNIGFKVVNEESIFEKAFRLDSKYDLILSILLRDPAIHAKTICNYIDPNMDEDDYRKILNQLDNLLYLDLISESIGDAEPIGNFRKNTIPYELTLGGIMYIISNFEIGIFFGFDPLKQLLENYNYPKNLLFKQFLYPYFAVETLLKDVGLRTELLGYLNRICKIIQQTMTLYYTFSHPELAQENLIENRYVPTLLFNWPKSKTTDTINKAKIITVLKHYLHKEFKWDWIRDSRIQLDYQNDKIQIIGKNNNYLVISISSVNKSATLFHKGRKYNDLFTVYNEKTSLAVLGKGPTVKESIDKPFLFLCQRELVSLLFTLRHRSVKDKTLEDTLSNDPLFRKAIDEMIDILKIKK